MALYVFYKPVLFTYSINIVVFSFTELNTVRKKIYCISFLLMQSLYLGFVTMLGSKKKWQPLLDYIINFAEY